MPGELYNNLLAAEKAINEIWPLAVAQSTAQHKKQSSEKEMRDARTEYKVGVWMLCICVPALILCLAQFFIHSSSTALVILILGSTLFGIFILSGIIIVPLEGIKCKRLKADIAAYQREIENATIQLENAKSHNAQGLALAHKLMPYDCFDPSHARVFVGYFETGRASTIPEALNLFEEYMHRYRMEQAAKEQLAQADAIKTEIRNVADAVAQHGYK